MRSLCLVLLFAAACGRDSKEDPSAALPAAQSWDGKKSAVGESAGMNMGGGDPHAGMDMGGGDPHAGLNMVGGDPHAGMDMGGGDPHAGLDMGGGDPHAGMDMGGDSGGLQPPDPNRKVDPTLFLKGTLRASKEMAARMPPGAVIFLSVRPVHKATGESLGSPLAVERLEVQSFPISFHLSAAQSMVAGTAFEGDVMVYARVDGDGEASTNQAGDIEGSVMATIPAAGLRLELAALVGG